MPETLNFSPLGSSQRPEGLSLWHSLNSWHHREGGNWGREKIYPEEETVVNLALKQATIYWMMPPKGQETECPFEVHAV